MLEGVGSAIIARDLAYELSGTTDHFVEVLNHQVVYLLCPQKRFCHSIQLVSDVNGTIRALQLGERPGRPAVAAGDIA